MRYVFSAKKKSKRKSNGSIQRFISLVNQFRDADVASHPNLELSVSDEASMQANRASWHKTCRQLYKVSVLDRARSRSEGSPPLQKLPRRSTTESNRNLCLFCNETTSKDDHSFQKFPSSRTSMTYMTRTFDSLVVWG